MKSLECKILSNEQYPKNTPTTTITALLALKSEWNTLVSSNPSLSFAQTFDWNYGLICHCLDKHWMIYLLYNKDKELIAIAPLLKEGRTLTFIGDQDTHAGTFNFIHSSTIQKEELDFLLYRILKDHLFSLLYLRGLNSKLSEIVYHLLMINKDYFHESVPCYRIIIPSSEDVYKTNILSSHSRRTIKQKINKFSKTFSDTNLVIKDNVEVLDEDIINDVFEIYAKRIIDKLGEFRYKEDYIDFLKTFIVKNSRNVFLIYIEVDGKMAAFRLGFNIQNPSYVEEIMGNHDPAFNCYGIGSILLYYDVLEQIKIKKKVLDLGRGNKEYKLSAGAIPYDSFEFRYNYFTFTFSVLRKLIRKCMASEKLKSFVRKVIKTK